AEAVFPVDLLPFPIVAAVVRDRYFENAVAAPGHFRRHLGLEAESIRPQPDRLDDLPAKDFVAGLHVGEVEIGDHVREMREECVPQTMPVEHHAARVALE